MLFFYVMLNLLCLTEFNKLVWGVFVIFQITQMIVECGERLQY